MDVTTTAVTLRIPRDSRRLPPNKQWENRFEVRSSSSNRIYVIAQHRERRHWGCSCPGWRRCEHLQELALPNHERPHEVIVGDAQ